MGLSQSTPDYAVFTPAQKKFAALFLVRDGREERVETSELWKGIS